VLGETFGRASRGLGRVDKSHPRFVVTPEPGDKSPPPDYDKGRKKADLRECNAMGMQGTLWVRHVECGKWDCDG